MNNYKIINKQKYLFNISFRNPTIKKAITLNPMSVLTLSIEEDLHNWPITGYIIFENPFNIFDKKFKKASDDISDDLIVDPYRFRNDGNDFIDVEIRPELDNDANVKIPQLNDELWKIKFTGVVYKKEEIPSPTQGKKAFKFYFWDSLYQKTIERDVIWSTSTSKYNPNFKSPTYDPIHSKDEERKMFTGDAIKAILLENGFEENDISQNWNKGEGKIFYTNPVNVKLNSAIDYLLKYHISSFKQGSLSNEIGDICFLDVHRWTRKFELTSITDIFVKAGKNADSPGEYQLEHLYYEDISGGGTSVQMSPNNPSEISPIERKLSFDKDIKIAKIKNYIFSDMSPEDNVYDIVTRYIHTYHNDTKTFEINSKYSDIKNLKEQIKNMYINNVYTDGSQPIALTLNNLKLNNQVSISDYSLYSERGQLIKKGLGELLYKGLILNQCLVFDVEGSTFRTSGKFMGIDKLSMTDTYTDYKLCGQWFTTNVKHIFQNEQYVNRIVAVKAHTFKDLGIPDNV